MDELFTTQHLIKTFKVSHQSIKNWCDEFAQYLSPTARPGEGKKRFFTIDDLKVLSLVSEYHKRGFRWEDTHTALKSGQLGEIPNTTDISPYESPTALAALKDELTNMQLLLRASENGKSEAEGQVKLLKEQISQKEQKIEELMGQNAELKAQLKRQE